METVSIINDESGNVPRYTFPAKLARGPDNYTYDLVDHKNTLSATPVPSSPNKVDILIELTPPSDIKLYGVLNSSATDIKRPELTPTPLGRYKDAEGNDIIIVYN